MVAEQVKPQPVARLGIEVSRKLIRRKYDLGHRCSVGV
jgi:hypothetical protein